jgi:hypothetical protein
MRLGGPFPFNPAGPFPIALGSGQYVYFPAGNYLVTPGRQSVLQWWDPILSTWRNYSCVPGGSQAISVDGYNYRLINQSGVVQAAAITNAGSGGVNGIGPTQTGTTVGFAAPGGNGQTAKGYVIIGGALSAPTITQAGSGFVVPPLILIDPPPAGGIQATATSTISAAGVLNGVTLLNVGAGYTSVPNFYVVPQFLDYPGQPALPYTIPTLPTPVAPNFPPGQIAIGPGGGGLGSAAGAIPQQFMQGLQAAFPFSAGALVTSGALTGSGTLTGLVVTDFGSLYTAVPAITFAGGTLAGGVAATALMSWVVTAITGSGGVAYTVGEPVISTLGELTPTTTAFNNNNLLQGREFHGVLTSTAGALSIEDPGFGFQVVMLPANFGVAQSSSIATTTVTFSAITMGGVTDTSVVQMFINE